ncbi:sigma factor, partial [Bacteroides finegoldii]
MKGDQNAFNDIVELYKDKVFQICFRMIGSRTEAEDLAQETFIRAYIHIKSFKQERKFSSW